MYDRVQDFILYSKASAVFLFISPSIAVKNMHQLAHIIVQ